MTAAALSNFFDLPLVGILRNLPSKHLQHILQAVQRGGMRYLEITMNSPAADDQIIEANRLTDGGVIIGAGTVTSPDLLNRALRAGAKFIVTPTVNESVIRLCEEAGVPIFPGAFTAAEVYQAWMAGPRSVTAVKVFPAELGAAKYIRALKAPFPNIRLMPTGGVDLSSLEAFVEAGADAFGIGSPLFQKDRLDAEDWAWLEGQTRAFVYCYQAAKLKFR